jgi:hypothetical protein
MPFKIKKNLQPGDWFSAEFGFEHKIFYVVEREGEIVFATRRNWQVSAAQFFTLDEIYDKREGRYIGTGKLRWWWKFLPWRDGVVKYSYPKNPR